jgi:hypothetical protein
MSSLDIARAMEVASTECPKSTHDATLVTDIIPAGGDVAPHGYWASSNSAFTLSRGSRNTPPLMSSGGRCFPGMLLSPFPFRIKVSHRTQKHSSKFLPTELGIHQGASRRTHSVTVGLAPRR